MHGGGRVRRGVSLLLRAQVINFFLLLSSMLMWVLETRCESYRRTALHVLRYASALLYHSARGALYLLVSLALLAQGEASPWLAARRGP